MTIPSSKTELLNAIIQESNKLKQEISRILIEFHRDNTIEGAVSVCDIMAYQIGYGKLLLGWYAAGLKNEMPDLPAKGFKWNQLGALATHFYKEYEYYSFTELFEILSNTIQSILEMVQHATEEELYTLHYYQWTGDKWTLGRWINVNSSSPYKSAAAKIRKWKKSKGL